MNLRWSYIFLMLLLVSGCAAIMPPSMLVGFPQGQEELEKNIVDVGYAVEDFATVLNKSHPGNRFGYRFQEYEPIVFGTIPGENLLV